MSNPNTPQWRPVPPGGQQWQPQPGQPQPYPQQAAYPPAPGYYPPQLPPGYEIRRKRPIYKRVWFWLLAIFVAGIVAVVASVASAANNAVNKPHTIVYSVTGTGTANLAYIEFDASGQTHSVNDDKVKLPWTKTFNVKGDMTVLSVSAIGDSFTNKVTLKCTMTVDGKVAATDTSTGTLPSVACAGSGYNGK